jgi:hypothetical protein
MLPRIIVFALLTALFTLALGVLQATVPALADVTALPQWGRYRRAAHARLFWRDGLRIAFFDRTMPLRRYLWTALLPLGFGLLAYAYARWVMHAAWPLTFNVALVANMVFGAVGEEIGWRGYLQRRLALGVGPLLSALSWGCCGCPSTCSTGRAARVPRLLWAGPDRHERHDGCLAGPLPLQRPGRSLFTCASISPPPYAAPCSWA